MTGEITLRGRIIPIGGLKEKCLAALRSHMTTVLIPDRNKKDIDELPKNVKDKLKIIPVKHMDDVIKVVLKGLTTKKKKKKPPATAPAKKKKTAAKRKTQPRASSH